MKTSITLSVILALVTSLLAGAALSDDTAARPYLNLKLSLPSDNSPTSTQTLVSHGLSYIGVRYRFGGTTRETGLDCSGLMFNVFQHAGVDLPRRSSDMARLGIRVSKDDLRPGDLVFFNTRRQAYSHVGLYVGDGQFLHAPSSGGQVRLDNMNARYWLARFNGARRLLSDEG